VNTAERKKMITFAGASVKKTNKSLRYTSFFITNLTSQTITKAQQTNHC
jgi:hypothetical protein